MDFNLINDNPQDNIVRNEYEIKFCDKNGIYAKLTARIESVAFSNIFESYAFNNFVKSFVSHNVHLDDLSQNNLLNAHKQPPSPNDLIIAFRNMPNFNKMTINIFFGLTEIIKKSNGVTFDVAVSAEFFPDFKFDDMFFESFLVISQKDLKKLVSQISKIDVFCNFSYRIAGVITSDANLRILQNDEILFETPMSALAVQKPIEVLSDNLTIFRTGINDLLCAVFKSQLTCKSILTVDSSVGFESELMLHHKLGVLFACNQLNIANIGVRYNVTNRNSLFEKNGNMMYAMNVPNLNEEVSLAYYRMLIAQIMPYINNGMIASVSININNDIASIIKEKCGDCYVFNYSNNFGQIGKGAMLFECRAPINALYLGVCTNII